MKDYCCPNCGKKQNVKLDIPSKITLTCINCGKPLLVQRDKTGTTIKVFDSG